MIAENTDINILKSTINNLIQENKQLYRIWPPCVIFYEGLVSYLGGWLVR